MKTEDIIRTCIQKKDS